MAKNEGTKTTSERAVLTKVKTPNTGRYTNKGRKPAGKTTFDHRRNIAAEINLYGP